jgi:hypothetical protein
MGCSLKLNKCFCKTRTDYLLLDQWGCIACQCSLPTVNGEDNIDPDMCPVTIPVARNEKIGAFW